MKNIYIQNLKKHLKHIEKEKENYYNFVKKEIVKIQNIISKFDLKKVVLFGSILNHQYFNIDSDLDIGIIGLEKTLFFELYRELSVELNVPFDLIDLDEDKEFKLKILSNCEVIYE